ncbi:baculoviral IAP repeat-containing protein 7-A-like [Uranotaenia lowii]|uniref:baculoviral IAP repeat-containing protein 7-A-like n=1 Tax=Uranotaenia lowii TaxID=190385 RepID=UPI002478D160|nr:baculoviral IAP repeat-containing protein 7-A-like [Uranotaenia lowii]
MNIELNRLRTFSSWEHAEWAIGNQFEVLAKAGFYATEQSLTVRCHFCGVIVFLGNSSDNIEEKHRELSPNCDFLLHPERTDNVQNYSATELKREECRLATFANWPVTYVTPAALAKAGFYFTFNADQVKCAWCEGIIGQWEIGDDPFTEHKKFFPNCEKVIANNISPNPILDASIGIQPVKPPHNAQFSSLDSRIRSFETWTMGHIQNPENLAHAGFYYLGRADEVHCFYCDGGLRFWLADDDPWFEHARCFPKCQFVQLVKGQLFIENVQKQINDGSSGSNQQQQHLQVSGQVSNVITLDEALSTEPVQLALSMGLNAGRIRAVTKRQLETTGRPFTDSQVLIEAVLDGQIQDEELEPTTSSRMDRRIENEVSRLLWNAISSSANPNMSSFQSTFPTDIDTTPESPPAEDATDQTPSNSESNFLATTTSRRLVEDSRPSEHKTIVPDPSATKPADGRQTSGTGELNDTLRLAEENKRLKDARECKICMSDEVGVVFCPCGHLVSCVQCAPAVSSCPVCRAAIKGRVRTFLS